MKNKNKILIFKKQNEIHQPLIKQVKFAHENREKKQKYQKLIGNKEMVTEKNEIPIQKIESIVKDKAKINHRTEDIQFKTKMFQIDFEMSDNEELAPRSFQKNIPKIKLSMPKSLKPEEFINDIRKSLIGDLKKTQSDLTLDQIFSLQITSHIVGIIPSQRSSIQFYENEEIQRVNRPNQEIQEQDDQYFKTQQYRPLYFKNYTQIGQQLNFPETYFSKKRQGQLDRNFIRNFGNMEENYSSDTVDNMEEEQKISNQLYYGSIKQNTYQRNGYFSSQLMNAFNTEPHYIFNLFQQDQT